MEEQKKELNLVEILKDCPKGTKLYSTIYGEVVFERVDHYDGVIYPICFYEGENFQCVTKNGLHLVEHDGECSLFPSKDNRDWSTFRIPFRDGDIVTYEDGDGYVKVFIFNEYTSDGYAACYVAYFDENILFLKKSTYGHRINRLATEEEKGKLFKAMADNGYKWNPDTKEVEQLEVEKPKWNPDTLQPFDKVLVRDGCNEPWKCDFFVSLDWPEGESYPYMAVTGYYKMIAPYNEETKHLIGTKQEAPEYYRL